jgi:hypothetical protein
LPAVPVEFILILSHVAGNRSMGLSLQAPLSV